MAAPLSIILLLQVLSINAVLSEDCIGTLTRGIYSYIHCDYNGTNVTDVKWVIYRRIGGPLNVTSDGCASPDMHGCDMSVQVFENGTLRIRGSSTFQPVRAVCLIQTINETHIGFDRTLSVLVPTAPFQVNAVYPSHSGDASYIVRYAGESFGLCVEADTFGLSSDRRSTFWRSSRRGDKYYPLDVTGNTSCTTCQCLVKELMERRRERQPRIEAFVALYKTIPCTVRANELKAVLIFHQTVLSDSGNYEFDFIDSNQLKPPNIEVIQVTVQGYLEIKPYFVNSFNSTIFISPDLSHPVVLRRNVYTSVGHVVQWVELGVEPTSVPTCNSTANSSCDGEEFVMCQSSTMEMISSEMYNGSFIMNHSSDITICNPPLTFKTSLAIVVVNDSNYNQTISISIETPPIMNEGPLVHIVYGVAVMVLAVCVIAMGICIGVMVVKNKAGRESSSINVRMTSVCQDGVTALAVRNEETFDSMEFPRNRLRFLQLIGEGEYGQVWKAQAMGIVRGEFSCSTVAVKTTKDAYDHSSVEDLQFELDIMKAIEPHPNILNLLGYCTQPDDQPVFLIMEYALHGNLKEFLHLLVHSESINVNQDPLIGRGDGGTTSSRDGYPVIAISDAACDDHVTITQESCDQRPAILTEKDTFAFALQIARGMEHLHNMKCIHRDLAARNILVAEGLWLKISDFGLAKRLDENDYYRQFSSNRLPARWMAVESLTSQLHTKYSDVWSFGVVLWEILTYGETPYSRDGDVVNTLESLVAYIESGNRLYKPHNCSEELYQLMMRCWNKDPKERPSFTELVEIFDKLLSLAHGYLPMATDSCSNMSSDSVPAYNTNKLRPSPSIIMYSSDNHLNIPIRDHFERTSLRSFHLDLPQSPLVVNWPTIFNQDIKPS